MKKKRQILENHYQASQIPNLRIPTNLIKKSNHIDTKGIFISCNLIDSGIKPRGKIKKEQPSEEDIKAQELEQEWERLDNAAERTEVAKQGHAAFQARTEAKIAAGKADRALAASGNITGIPER